MIKTNEGLQRFAFITGVSKFSKVSIFSDLNNLRDLSMDPRAATLLGYTHDEVRTHFPQSVARLAEKNGWTFEQTFAKLVQWYDGYRFNESGTPVFNPVSIGTCLSAGEIAPYWFETGTPTFLIQILKRQPVDLSAVEIPMTAFSVYEPATPTLLPLLYQTGYLTILTDRWEGDDHVFRLGFPNLEVRKSFSEMTASSLAEITDLDRSSLLSQMMSALRAHDVNDMLDALSCFFANIPANITLANEKYYQSLFYAVFVLIGARTQAECWTNRGRIDAMVETEKDVYLFEFKLHDSAAAALAQIREREYAEKYRRAGKRLTLVGVAFDAIARNLADRAIAEA